MATQHLRVLPDVVWRMLPDEVLALGPTSDEVTSIRGSGLALWASLLDGASTETLTGDAVRAGCPSDRAPRMVREVLDALATAGLVEFTP
mgnify:FL=1